MNFFSFTFTRIRKLREGVIRILDYELLLIFIVFIICNTLEAFSVHSYQKQHIPDHVIEAKERIKMNKCGSDEANSPEMLRRCNAWRNTIKQNESPSIINCFIQNIIDLSKSFFSKVGLEARLKIALSFVFFFALRKIFPKYKQ